jgi:hypothetical protein
MISSISDVIRLHPFITILIIIFIWWYYTFRFLLRHKREFIKLNLELYKKYIKSDFEKYRHFDFGSERCQMGADGYSEKGTFSHDYKRWKGLQQEFMGKLSASEKASYEKILFSQVPNNPKFLWSCRQSWSVHSHWDWPLHMWEIPQEYKAGIQFAIKEAGELGTQSALRSEQSRNSKSIVTNFGWCPQCTKKISAIATKCPYCTADL